MLWWLLMAVHLLLQLWVKLSKPCVSFHISSVTPLSSALPRRTLHLLRPVKVCICVCFWFSIFCHSCGIRCKYLFVQWRNSTSKSVCSCNLEQLYYCHPVAGKVIPGLAKVMVACCSVYDNCLMSAYQNWDQNLTVLDELWEYLYVFICLYTCTFTEVRYLFWWLVVGEICVHLVLLSFFSCKVTAEVMFVIYGTLLCFCHFAPCLNCYFAYCQYWCHR